MALRIDPQLAQSPGISYQELLDRDSRAVPDVLRLTSPQYLGSDDLPVERYTSRAWHELEVERLWKRGWQFACREEEIPETGDYHVYDIATMSFVVVRTATGAIKPGSSAPLVRSGNVGRGLGPVHRRALAFGVPRYEAARVMVGQRSGVILSTASTAGIMGGLGPHAYTACKHAVIGLTKSVAAELAPHGIRVNAVAPGNTVTAMTAIAYTGDASQTDTAAERIRAWSPLGIAGQPVDIANAALYLVSDEDELESRREAYGLSYITVPESAAGDFAPVVARLAGG